MSAIGKGAGGNHRVSAWPLLVISAAALWTFHLCETFGTLSWLLLAVSSLLLLTAWGRGMHHCCAQRRLLGLTLQDLDRLDGLAFEAWVVRKLEAAGFVCRATPQSRDYGIDVVAERGRLRIGIQAKRNGRPVGNGAVMQAIAGSQYHDCDVAAVVTQSRFTKAACAQAARAGLPVLLLDRVALPRLGGALRRCRC
jgi:HJR/Mrr/RecB family endonuclease